MQSVGASLSLAETLAGAVDERFYLRVYGNLPPGFTPASHYAALGWKQGYDPNPWFSTQAYVDDNPDIANSEIIPLFHYLEFGAQEGRSAKPSRHASAYFTGYAEAAPPSAVADSDAPPDEDFERRVIRNGFDSKYYLALNPDVAQAGVDPLTHFIEQGWREGRDPNALFSIAGYLEENADVGQAGMNPFYHYLIAGRAEGRGPRKPLGFRYYVLSNQSTVEQRMANATEVPNWRAGSRHQLLRALSSLTRSQQKAFYVSVSHDDFSENVGGVQLCLRREAAAFESRGIDHVHLFPGRTSLVTDREHQDPLIGVLVNGVLAGHFRSRTIESALHEAIDTTNAWPSRTFAIHSLLGHNVEALATILKAVDMRRGYFWLHDYASICAGLQLLRNDVEFCGVPEPDSTTCRLCIYGERRRIQLADHEFFFSQFHLTVVAPAKSALETWKSGTNLRPQGGAVVHPHCRLKHASPKETPAQKLRDAEPLRVAFLGLPAVHKGWPVFRDLIVRFAGDDRYTFFHLGMNEQAGLPLRFLNVRVEDGALDAMVRAVDELQIDVAIIWSLWPETFCFTAYEAIAGGAYVIAPANSGNVARMLAETGKGIVPAGEEELTEIFESGSVLSLARSQRPTRDFTLDFSQMTADLISSVGRQ